MITERKIYNNEIELRNLSPSDDLGHYLLWLKDDEIGEPSVNWNWLVGEYDNPTKDIKVLHWTLGGPYFDEYANTEFSDEWRKELDSMNFCKQL